MVSSALSSRRGLLRRPKVCFTHINPGRCEPPPPPPPGITCSILTDINPIPIFSEDTPLLFACNPALGLHDVTVAWDVPPFFHVINISPPENCVAPGLAVAWGDVTGNFHVEATFTFSDESECTDFVDYVVVPM